MVSRLRVWRKRKLVPLLTEAESTHGELVWPRALNCGENKRKFITKRQMRKQGWEYSFMIEAMRKKAFPKKRVHRKKRKKERLGDLVSVRRVSCEGPVSQRRRERCGEAVG